MKHRMPLSLASAGCTCLVTGIRGDSGVRRRLAEMGLICGVTIKVATRVRSGPLLIDIKRSRLGVGHGVAQNVVITTEDNDGKQAN